MTDKYVVEVLRLFGEADCQEELMWQVADGDVSFSALCSDTFDWGTADSERIEREDLPLLQRCYDDLRGLDSGLWYLPTLFAARKRKRVPMPQFMERMADRRPSVSRLLREAE